MQREAGIATRLDSNGRMGELTVWVGEKRVFRKGFFKFPEKAAVLQTVQQALAELPGSH